MAADGIIVEYRVGENGDTLPVVVLDATDASFDGIVNFDVPVLRDLDLEKALNRLRPGVEKLVAFVQGFDIESADVEFGVELSTKVGAVIASGEGKVNFKVSLKISRKPTHGEG